MKCQCKTDDDEDDAMVERMENHGSSSDDPRSCSAVLFLASPSVTVARTLKPVDCTARRDTSKRFLKSAPVSLERLARALQRTKAARRDLTTGSLRFARGTRGIGGKPSSFRFPGASPGPRRNKESKCPKLRAAQSKAGRVLCNVENVELLELTLQTSAAQNLFPPRTLHHQDHQCQNHQD
ncbi:hypothetical protein KUF71_010277 [Frankliniella fusca]|uniref:Uncharacterized protein n=1 Tax=Frankliniella fusca TaxID=407009 RepID=A0AAE1HGQ8_9NEOP|nr:hypothetical protein KUF71_010277 [Frankliniella fusca]